MGLLVAAQRVSMTQPRPMEEFPTTSFKLETGDQKGRLMNSFPFPNIPPSRCD